MSEFEKYIRQGEPQQVEKARIWQIHSFGEGNTRTTAVFTIKYLRSFGFDINNDLFEKHSWYFRNALVRANYHNLSNCRVIRKRFDDEFIAYLLDLKWWDWDIKKIEVNFEALSSGDLSLIKKIDK